MVADIYPSDIHGIIADFLREDEFEIQIATLDEPEHGLTANILNETDVFFWWGHMTPDEVKDEIVEKVKKRVLDDI